MARFQAGSGVRIVRVRDMVVRGQIGVHAHEHGREQRLRIDLEAAVDEAGGPVRDEVSEVVDYSRLVDAVRRTVASGHVRLVETLAERIAGACLFDARIRTIRVRVEKLDVYEDVAGVGVEIERRRPDLSTAED